MTPVCWVTVEPAVTDPATDVPVARKTLPTLQMLAPRLSPVWAVDMAPVPALTIIGTALDDPSSETDTLFPMIRVEFAPSATDESGVLGGSGTLTATDIACSSADC